MKMLNRILLAVDVNQETETLTRAAGYIAKNFGANYTLLHVIPESAGSKSLSKMIIEAIQPRMDEIRQELEKQGASVQKVILENGSPFDKIIEAGEEADVNAIMLGSGRLRGDQKYPLGITAQKIIRKTNIPVWVVKDGQQEGYKHIVCPVDFSEPSKRALQNAIMIAHKTGAELSIISVYEPLTYLSRRIKADLETYNRENIAEQQKQFENFLENFDFKNIKWNKELLQGIPHETILRMISERRADLLIMGTTGKTGLSRVLMGSVTEKVIREVPCSFITTKSRNIIDPNFEWKIATLEQHLRDADARMKEGLWNEAINHLEQCLQMDDMFLPAIFKLAKAYRGAGNQNKALYYEKSAQSIIQRLWNDEELKKLVKD